MNPLLQLSPLYGDANLEATAERELRQPKQSASVADYAAKFEQHRQHLDYNDSAFRDLFYHGLKDGIKDELARNPRPATLRELKEAAIRLDARFHERYLERRLQATTRFSTPALMRPGHVPQTGPMPATARSSPVPAHQPGVVQPKPSASTSSFPAFSPDGTVPMEIGTHGKWQLTAAEKLRRKQLKLCSYCASAGHDVSQCPSRPRPHFERQALQAVELEEGWKEAKDDTQE